MDRMVQTKRKTSSIRYISKVFQTKVICSASV